MGTNLPAIKLEEARLKLQAGMGRQYFILGLVFCLPWLFSSCGRSGDSLQNKSDLSSEHAEINSEQGQGDCDDNKRPGPGDGKPPVVDLSDNANTGCSLGTGAAHKEGFSQPN